MAKQLFSNNASSTLAVSIDAADTTIQVQSGYGALFPSPTGGDWFLITLEDNNANTEVVKCTSRSGDLLTVTRAQEGTSAQSFTNTVTRVELRNTKGTLERMLQRSGDTLGGDLDLGGYELTNGSLGADVVVPQASIWEVGMIMLWSGSIASIPSGWALCNGANGTPDLRDRFVVGAGSTYAVDDTGGAATDAITTASGGAHDHGGATGSHTLTTSEIPSHTHTVLASTHSGDDNDPLSMASRGFAGGGQAGTASLTTNGSGTSLVSGGGSGGGHDHTIASEAAHTHTATVDTIPPYYALAYIMFTG